MKSITVSDLKDQIGTPFPRPSLFCRQCAQLASANRGDYFAAPPDHVFTCCNEPMQLVIRRVTFESVNS